MLGPLDYHIRSFGIAKNQNTFAKLQRERNKKAKAEAKRNRRNKRKLEGQKGDSSESPDGAQNMGDVEAGAETETPTADEKT